MPLHLTAYILFWGIGSSFLFPIPMFMSVCRTCILSVSWPQGSLFSCLGSWSFRCSSSILCLRFVEGTSIGHTHRSSSWRHMHRLFCGGWVVIGAHAHPIAGNIIRSSCVLYVSWPTFLKGILTEDFMATFVRLATHTPSNFVRMGRCF